MQKTDNHDQMSYLASDGRSFVVRQPTQNDAEELINYSKILFASTDQLLTTLEEYDITVENEKVWINNLVQNPNAHILIAELNNRIVGFLFFVANSKKKNSHTGEFVEKIYLNVFDSNQSAKRLYKKLGFVEEGRHIKAAKQIVGRVC